jgi:hypothetical protein
VCGERWRRRLLPALHQGHARLPRRIDPLREARGRPDRCCVVAFAVVEKTRREGAS